MLIARDKSSTNMTSDLATNAKRYVSDGFETASDGEFGASDSDAEEQQPKQLEPQGQEEPQQQQKLQDQKFPDEEELDKPIVSPGEDEEQKQKAMAQSNEAKMDGNKLYGSGEYEEALSKYEFALYLAPLVPSSVELRSTCHSNRAICLLKLVSSLFYRTTQLTCGLFLKKTSKEQQYLMKIQMKGKPTETVKECTKALELNPSYLKALLRRAEAHEKLEHFEEAIADMKKVLELDPSNEQARKSIRHLEPLIEEKREKMKEEMIAKLKEMGNSVLGRFGMSVDNFKPVKDVGTGSYSISFQR